MSRTVDLLFKLEETVDNLDPAIRAPLIKLIRDIHKSIDKKPSIFVDSLKVIVGGCVAMFGLYLILMY